jgi:hypothetical protein
MPSNEKSFLFPDICKEYFYREIRQMNRRESIIIRCENICLFRLSDRIQAFLHMIGLLDSDMRHGKPRERVMMMAV